jgi:membrane-associated phospholipid phosphatase
MRPDWRPSRPAVWFAFLAGFVVLCAFAAAFDRFPGDLWLVQRLQDTDSAAFDWLLDRAEDLVDEPVWIVVWLAGVLALFAGSHRPQALILLASAAARLFNPIVKEIVGRPRPDDDLISVLETSSSPSFPSGHANSAFLLYGLLFYFVTVLVRRPALRLAGQAICLAVVLLSGIERPYVGAHWPSDVLGGYYLAGLALVPLIALDRRIAAGNR